ncbi:hypothetical protein LTR09_006661 [Extremus antarcticus]|uniref:Uncharacterized protein n=1 Tax=Extremus antarcticus TaxID=702011 RepID=A0AAJ0DLA4_9PEZI|nr:hypothetical protein LTR09_006661 [Extremus antarcticus]
MDEHRSTGKFQKAVNAVMGVRAYCQGATIYERMVNVKGVDASPLSGKNIDAPGADAPEPINILVVAQRICDGMVM